ncbi:MAG: biotin/lipoyl-binding protein [Clostridiaceae bacterium]|nr:biotin/lipoyl-binding protein [Clostridiaceae bacterium]
MKTFRIVIDGVEHVVQVEEMGSAAPAPVAQPVAPAPAPAPVAASAPVAPAPVSAPAGDGEVVVAPLQGKIFTINVNVGDQVKAGDTLVVIEAMKMENEIPAPHDGEIASISVGRGDNVAAGDPLVTYK